MMIKKPTKVEWRKGAWFLLGIFLCQTLYLVPAFSISTPANLVIDAVVVMLLLLMQWHCGVLISLGACVLSPCFGWAVSHSIDGFMTPVVCVALLLLVGCARVLRPPLHWVLSACVTALVAFAGLLVGATLAQFFVKGLALMKALNTAFNDRIFYGLSMLLGCLAAFWLGRFKRISPAS